MTPSNSAEVVAMGPTSAASELSGTCNESAGSNDVRQLTRCNLTNEGGWYGQPTYGDQTQLFTVTLVPQYTTHAAGFGGLDPVG
jgi:hypothetical protein